MNKVSDVIIWLGGNCCVLIVWCNSLRMIMILMKLVVIKMIVGVRFNMVRRSIIWRVEESFFGVVNFFGLFNRFDSCVGLIFFGFLLLSDLLVIIEVFRFGWEDFFCLMVGFRIIKLVNMKIRWNICLWRWLILGLSLFWWLFCFLWVCFWWVILFFFVIIYGLFCVMILVCGNLLFVVRIIGFFFG